MNIFDIIDGIAFSKNENLINSPETEKEYSPFIVNRWLSMLDPIAAKIINITVNKNIKQLNTVQDQYNFLLNVLPKFGKQRINYIKKPSKSKSS
jgi:hypothetical protein